MSRTIVEGCKLGDWRRRQGWSQQFAANWAGVDRRTWQRYERGDLPSNGILPLWLTRRIQDHMLMREWLERLRCDVRFDPVSYAVVDRRSLTAVVR